MYSRKSALPLALAWACLAAGPVMAQEAQACVNEVQRLSQAFAIEPGGARADIATQPGARKGATLSDEQRQRVGTLVTNAREAGERGDEQGCLQRLGEARALLRQAGLGGGQPGTADSPGTSTGSIGTDIGAGGAATTLPRGTTAPGLSGSGTGGAGGMTGGGSGGSSGSSGGGS